VRALCSLQREQFGPMSARMRSSESFSIRLEDSKSDGAGAAGTNAGAAARFDTSGVETPEARGAVVSELKLRPPKLLVPETGDDGAPAPMLATGARRGVSSAVPPFAPRRMGHPRVRCLAARGTADLRRLSSRPRTRRDRDRKDRGRDRQRNGAKLPRAGGVIGPRGYRLSERAREFTSRTRKERADCVLECGAEPRRSPKPFAE